LKRKSGDKKEWRPGYPICETRWDGGLEKNPGHGGGGKEGVVEED